MAAAAHCGRCVVVGGGFPGRQGWAGHACPPPAPPTPPTHTFDDQRCAHLPLTPPPPSPTPLSPTPLPSDDQHLTRALAYSHSRPPTPTPLHPRPMLCTTPPSPPHSLLKMPFPSPSLPPCLPAWPPRLTLAASHDHTLPPTPTCCPRFTSLSACLPDINFPPLLRGQPRAPPLHPTTHRPPPPSPSPRLSPTPPPPSTPCQRAQVCEARWYSAFTRWCAHCCCAWRVREHRCARCCCAWRVGVGGGGGGRLTRAASAARARTPAARPPF